MYYIASKNIPHPHMKKGLIIAIAGVIALPLLGTADYAKSVLEAYEAGLIQYNELPDSMKSYVLIIDSDRGDTGRIERPLPKREHINDVFTFYQNYDELETLAEEIEETVTPEPKPVVEEPKVEVKPSYVAKPAKTVNPAPSRQMRSTGAEPRPRKVKTETTVERKYRPSTEPNFRARAVEVKPEPTNPYVNAESHTEKQYLTRRSYYFYDHKDQQTADYVRVKNRVQPGYSGLPYSVN